MSEPRPFPPSPRRLALARASGLTAASPLLVGAAAAVGAIAATVFLARAAAAHVGTWIAAACNASDGLAASVAGTTSPAPTIVAGPTSATRAPAAIDVTSLPAAILELALPLLIAGAVAALVVHVAQTRSLWLPRRTLPGAPRLPRRDVSRSVLDLLGTMTIGAVCIGWLWLTAPQLAQVVTAATTTAALLAGVGGALASLLVALAIAWVALGALDALVRHVQVATALMMTRDEKREDDRLAAVDPRWRAQRLAIARGENVSDSVAQAAVVLLGDDVAVAIAWDPTRQPVPLRTATGRRARATQLVGLARRHRVPVHRDAELAARLIDAEGPVPDTEWAHLADLFAAIRR
jgi:flagellar biosynthesis protein FlhB